MAGRYHGPLGTADGEELTGLIQACRAGDEASKQRLFAIVHDELRRIARRTLYVGAEGDTNQPTAIANDVYVELERRFPPPPREAVESRATFFRTVALATRTLLRDKWRARNTAKRTPGASVLGNSALIAHADPADADHPVDLFALDESLELLKAFNQRWYDVVSLRFYADRSVEDTAELLGIGPTTVKSDWALARAWLRRQLEGDA